MQRAPGNSATQAATGWMAALGAADGGYHRLEVAIPWSTSHMAPEPGLHMGLEMQINDDDSNTGTDRDGKVAWFATSVVGDEVWQRPDAFGSAVLGD